MDGETFAKIALTGVDARMLVTNRSELNVTFTCICGYDDSTANLVEFYICPNCDRVYMLSMELIMYNPKDVQ